AYDKYLVLVDFFFFKQKTAYEMCMCTSPEPQGELHASRRLNSRRSSSIASTSCTNTDATDNHHSQRSSKPGSREMITPGMATSAMRTTDAMSEGMVLPIAWNVLEATNTRPDAT